MPVRKLQQEVMDQGDYCKLSQKDDMIEDCEDSHDVQGYEFLSSFFRSEEAFVSISIQ